MKNQILTEIIDRIPHLGLNNTGKQNIDQGERIVSVLAGSWLLYNGLLKIGKHPLLGLQGAVAGGFMLYRGATGLCPIYEKLNKDTTDPQAINITDHITVNAPRDMVYRFWRELSNLPKFMYHLKSVDEISTDLSKWTARTPGDLIDLHWDAEITREQEGSYIGWQSVKGSMIANAGKVEFRDSLNGTGTEIHIEVDYFPPAGSVGRGITSLFNGIFERMIREDIQRFKSYAEEGDFKLYAGLS